MLERFANAIVAKAVSVLHVVVQAVSVKVLQVWSIQSIGKKLGRNWQFTGNQLSWTFKGSQLEWGFNGDQVKSGQHCWSGYCCNELRGDNEWILMVHFQMISERMRKT